MKKINKTALLEITGESLPNEEAFVRTILTYCGGYVPLKAIRNFMKYRSEEAFQTFMKRINKHNSMELTGDSTFIKHMAAGNYSSECHRRSLAMMALSIIVDNIYRIYQITFNPPYNFMVFCKNDCYKIAVMDDSNKNIINTLFANEGSMYTVVPKEYAIKKIIVFPLDNEEEYMAILNQRTAGISDDIKMCMGVDVATGKYKILMPEAADNLESNISESEDEDNVENA